MGVPKEEHMQQHIHPGCTNRDLRSAWRDSDPLGQFDI